MNVADNQDMKSSRRGFFGLLAGLAVAPATHARNAWSSLRGPAPLLFPDGIPRSCYDAPFRDDAGKQKIGFTLNVRTPPKFRARIEA